MKSRKKRKIHKLISALTISIGIMFLLYGIFVEDDPNLVAPLFIVGGAVWYFVTRSKIRSQHT